MEIPQPRPLQDGFETEYATSLIAVDALWGGDPGILSAEARFIADAYPTAEVQLPEAYSDQQIADLRSDNAEPNDSSKKLSSEARAELVRSIVDRFDLLNIRERLVGTLGSNVTPLHRRFTENMGGCLDVMARLAASKADSQVPAPSFEERYRAAVYREPELLDTAGLRERLRAALAGVGLEATRSRDLRETSAAYENKAGIVATDQFAKEVERVCGALMGHIRTNVFGKIGFEFRGHAGHHLEDVAFDGLRLGTFHRPDSHITGSSLYEGGFTQDGKPAFKAFVEYNTGHPVTPHGLYHFCAHEMKPGHYVDSVLADLGWHSGKHGLEGAVHTMCTAETAAREGWAQVALAMAFGGSEQQVIDALGKEHAVEFALGRLVDAGKHNGPILFQRDQKSLDELGTYLAQDCVQSDLYVRKLKAWSRHPILGSMYAPGYAVGHDVFTKAIEKYGALRVAEVALHQRGFQDIDTFQRAFEQ